MKSRHDYRELMKHIKRRKLVRSICNWLLVLVFVLASVPVNSVTVQASQQVIIDTPSDTVRFGDVTVTGRNPVGGNIYMSLRNISTDTRIDIGSGAGDTDEHIIGSGSTFTFTIEGRLLEYGHSYRVAIRNATGPGSWTEHVFRVHERPTVIEPIVGATVPFGNVVVEVYNPDDGNIYIHLRNYTLEQRVDLVGSGIEYDRKLIGHGSGYHSYTIQQHQLTAGHAYRISIESRIDGQSTWSFNRYFGVQAPGSSPAPIVPFGEFRWVREVTPVLPIRRSQRDDDFLPEGTWSQWPHSGDRLFVESVQGEWAKIRDYSGRYSSTREGYVFRDHLAVQLEILDNRYVVAWVPSTPFFAGRGTSPYNIQIPSGTPIYVHYSASANGIVWARIDYMGLFGYVNASYLRERDLRPYDLNVEVSGSNIIVTGRYVDGVDTLDIAFRNRATNVRVPPSGLIPVPDVSNGTFTHTFTGLSPGEHHVAVRATSNSGRVTRHAWAEYVFTVSQQQVIGGQGRFNCTDPSYPFTFWLQDDGAPRGVYRRWNTYPYGRHANASTFGQAACGLFAVKNALHYLGIKMTVDYLHNAAVVSEARINRPGTNVQVLLGHIERNHRNISFHRTSVVSEVRAHVAGGGVAIINYNWVNPTTPDQLDGHFMTIIAECPTRGFFVQDPLPINNRITRGNRFDRYGTWIQPNLWTSGGNWQRRLGWEQYLLIGPYRQFRTASAFAGDVANLHFDGLFVIPEVQAFASSELQSFRIDYDPHLLATSASNIRVENALVHDITMGDGTIEITLLPQVSESPLPSPVNEVSLEIAFSISHNAPANAQIPVTLVNLSDESQIVEGTIIVWGEIYGNYEEELEEDDFFIIPGDANGDREVNDEDIILIKRHLAEHQVTICLIAADVTANGEVDDEDIIKLMRYLAEHPVELLQRNPNAVSIREDIRVGDMVSFSHGNDFQSLSSTPIQLSISPLLENNLSALGFDLTNPQGVTANTGNIGGRVSISHENASHGEYVDVVVRLDENDGISSLRLRLNYDSAALSLVSVTSSNLIPLPAQPLLENNPFVLGFIVSAIEYAVTGTGNLATLRFRVLDNAPAATTSIDVTVVSAFKFDNVSMELGRVNIGESSGSVTISDSTGTGDIPPTITSRNTLDVTYGSGGSLTLTATGTTPIEFTLVGAPPGVSISGNQLIIANTVAEDTHSFTIRATNVVGHDPQPFTLTINTVAVEPIITSRNTLEVPYGSGGSLTLTATGTTPIEFTLVDAPPGVSISGNQLIIANTVETGLFSFIIRATNAAGYDPQSFALVVRDTTASSPAIISQPTLAVPQGEWGSLTLRATGTTPINFTLSNAPAGVSINGGQLIVAPTVGIGESDFIITATNEVGRYPQNFTLTVNRVTVRPEIVSSFTTTVLEGSGASFQIIATGTTPISYSLSGAPAGVSINGSQLIIAPTLAVGPHNFTITATNEAGSYPQNFTLTVNTVAVAPTITNVGSFTVTQGTNSSFPLTASGTAPIDFTLSSAPAGVSISGGQLHIAPTVMGGTHTLTITATNSAGSISRDFTLMVTAPVFERRVIRFTIGNTLYTINGYYWPNDEAPFIDPRYGRTMIPLRAVGEALDAQFDWSGETRTAIILTYDGTLSVVVGVPLPDGMGTPTMVGDRVFVPLRYVSEMLGADVRWDGANSRAYVYQ